MRSVMKGLKGLFMALLLTGITCQVHAQNNALLAPNAAYEEVVGIRLADMLKHGNPVPGLSDVQSYIESNQDSLFLSGKSVETVHIITLRDQPRQRAGQAVYPLTAFVEYKSGEFVFEKFSVTKDLRTSQLSARLEQSVDLSQTRLKAQVALIERALLITDERSDIRMVLPLGVGSFDEGVLNEEPSLLTPRFKVGYMSKTNIIKNRTKPKYFAGKPFVRVLWGQGKKHTGIGFHAQPNLDPFIRAFDSHGCIRMQLEDLEMLYHLVASNPQTYVPITITYEIEEKIFHPFPKRDKSYMGVANVGSTSNPMYTIDRDYLIQTGGRSKAVPTHLLRDFPEDDYENYFNYSSEPCKIKSFGKEPKEGWSETLTSTTAFQRCEPRTRRNRLYRFFVH